MFSATFLSFLVYGALGATALGGLLLIALLVKDALQRKLW